MANDRHPSLQRRPHPEHRKRTVAAASRQVDERSSAGPRRLPTLVLGVTGSSSAYKICNLIRLLRRTVDMHVVMTQTATEFIHPRQFHVLTGNQVLLNLWSNENRTLHPHVDLSSRADAFLIAPASADIIGKLASGVATDALSTLALSVDPSTTPCLLAPAMMPRLLAHPAVKRNIRALKRWGYQIIEPSEGRLADGMVGVGRLAEPEMIAASVRQALGL